MVLYLNLKYEEITVRKVLFFSFSGQWTTAGSSLQRRHFQMFTGLVAAMLSCQVLRMHVNSLTGSALTRANSEQLIYSE